MCDVSPSEHTVYIIFPIIFAWALKLCRLYGLEIILVDKVNKLENK